MKYLTAIILALFLGFGAIPSVYAQAAGTIWMETNQQSYGGSENVIITIKANAGTPVQGFTFQLRYDPACLEPTIPNSLVSGFNLMSVPQTAGLVDAIFASTTPLNINGALAEVQFKPLASCQTTLTLENASLAVMDASGMAVPLPGISLGASSLVLGVGGASASAAQPTSPPQANPTSALETSATSMPEAEVTPTTTPALNVLLNWLLIPLAIFLGLIFIIGLIVILWFLMRNQQPLTSLPSPARKSPALFIKRGPRAGTTLLIERFPCRIGSSPQNEIYLEDSRISPAHAEIFADQSGYTLVDLGSQNGTFLNGRQIQEQQVRLKAGDVLRLGGVLLVFGPV